MSLGQDESIPLAVVGREDIQYFFIENKQDVRHGQGRPDVPDSGIISQLEHKTTYLTLAFALIFHMSGNKSPSLAELVTEYADHSHKPLLNRGQTRRGRLVRLLKWHRIYSIRWRGQAPRVVLWIAVII